VLGAFIKNGKSTSRSGVPILQDIPLLGSLFSQQNKSKQREELIVLMRPTVLKTPQIAAINTAKLEQTLPGASAAMAEDVAEQSKLVEAQRKKEQKNAKTMSGGFYNTPQPGNPSTGQSPRPQPQPQGDDFFPPTTPTAPANNNTQPPL
jgi:Flp pilus assembly secretin CpaC